MSDEYDDWQSWAYPTGGFRMPIHLMFHLNEFLTPFTDYWIVMLCKNIMLPLKIIYSQTALVYLRWHSSSHPVNVAVRMLLLRFKLLIFGENPNPSGMATGMLAIPNWSHATYPDLTSFYKLMASEHILTWGRFPHYWPFHDDVIKWKHFPRYWPFVRGIDLRLNQELSRQWRRRWFETPSRPLWRHWNVWDGNPQATSGYDAVMVLRLLRRFILYFCGNQHMKRNDIYSPCLRPRDRHSVVPWAAFSYISQYQPFVGAMFHLIFPFAILAWSTSQTDLHFQIAIFRGNFKRRGKSHVCVRLYPRVADNIYVV